MSADRGSGHVDVSVIHALSLFVEDLLPVPFVNQFVEISSLERVNEIHRPVGLTILKAMARPLNSNPSPRRRRGERIFRRNVDLPRAQPVKTAEPATA